MCGVFGVFNHPEAANLTYLGLHALQHRGQESAGIVTSEGGTLHAVRKMGLVSEVFTSDVFAQLPGRGDRPRPLHHRRRLAAQEHPAADRRGPAQLDRRRPQRQPRQRRAAARRPRGGRRHLLLAVDTEVILQLMARSRATASSSA
jgi:hypothetical protein